ncbi:MAG TPA: [protein-PII] uridylyltransferase, partial [Candidatus Hydrogenedentes bacterium]|nr:[protein-PII] uridylyltransferase [Candidatus Hydrogenedentota bacterium]
MCTELCDEIVKAGVSFGLASVSNPDVLLSRVAVCALGGYGRGEMSPESDVDVVLLYDGPLNADLESLNGFLTTFFWDIGLHSGYSFHEVPSCVSLCAEDPRVHTSYLQSRVILGDPATLGRLKLTLNSVEGEVRERVMRHVRSRESLENLPLEYRDLFALEPDVKENAGGLRDYHSGLWMVQISRRLQSLDDLLELGLIDASEHLQLLDALDFIWRVRNEMHFSTGRCTDRLTFDLQKQIAAKFQYGESETQAVPKFMEDYYAATVRLREFLAIAARVCDQPRIVDFFNHPERKRVRFSVYHGMLCLNPSDEHWFDEKPTRLIEVFWEAAKRGVPVSPALARWISQNVHLINDTFRTSDVTRGYFTAICNRPFQAGVALREMARCGVLGAYIPEFEAVRGIIRYEDFHSYPVDEHTLRAVEALARIPRMRGEVSPLLYKAMEQLRSPHLLVLSVLLHDLGKVAGEVHAEESARIARTVTERMGYSSFECDQVEFLVRHHMAMSNIAFYRDTDNLDVVNSFAELIQTDDLLRMLLLLTYADLSAVGPDVWNEWKGALLLKLYLKTMRILTGRADVALEEFWTLPRAREVIHLVGEDREKEVTQYLRDMGERYLIGFSPEQVVRHMECLQEAMQTGLAVRCVANSTLGASDICVCTRDRHGLFALIAGSFAANLINVRNAALFTRTDGWVVDCFTVDNAVQRRPLTPGEIQSFISTLNEALRDESALREKVMRSRNRLFALQQSTVPVRSIVTFDDNASDSETVIDIVTADRTGLLYDITSTLSEMGVDFSAAHIRTDVGRVRDAFYVTMNGRKLETP